MRIENETEYVRRIRGYVGSSNEQIRLVLGKRYELSIEADDGVITRHDCLFVAVEGKVDMEKNFSLIFRGGGEVTKVLKTTDNQEEKRLDEADIHDKLEWFRANVAWEYDAQKIRDLIQIIDQLRADLKESKDIINEERAKANQAKVAIELLRSDLKAAQHNKEVYLNHHNTMMIALEQQILDLQDRIDNAPTYWAVKYRGGVPLPSLFYEKETAEEHRRYHEGVAVRVHLIECEDNE